jgi:hypothetical protein
MFRRLYYPAPRRETVQTEVGFASKKWSVAGVLSAIQDGAWFLGDAGHDFESGVGPFAREAQEVLQYLHEGSANGAV